MIRPPPRSTHFPSTTLFRSFSQMLMRPFSDLVAAPAALRVRALAPSGARRELAGGAEDGVLPQPPANGGSTSTTAPGASRSEEHTSELQSRQYLVCRLLLAK